jgi:hypothetical protein
VSRFPLTSLPGEREAIERQKKQAPVFFRKLFCRRFRFAGFLFRRIRSG